MDQSSDPDPDADPGPAFLSVTLLLFEGTLTSFFKDKKSCGSHKTVGNKVFLAIFVS
jgi:hypothetical protein